MFFFELIQVALGNRLSLSKMPSEQEWLEVYQMAEEQTLVGLLFSALEKLNEERDTIKPPIELFMEWIGTVVQIEEQNKCVNEAAALLTRLFKQKGHRTCVLKGQGIARLYPQPLRRQSGDVDLWVEGDRKDTIKFLIESYYGIGKVLIHHVDARIIDGIATEIHFLPCYSCNPILHRKLQRFFKRHSDSQFSNYDNTVGFAYPTLRFNAVYLLSHIYMHFLYEGIGLRQMVDYYYVLKKLSEDERRQAATDIKETGLMKIAGAVMYVMQLVCGLDDSLLVTKPDEKRGKLLLDEIMVSGNFGKYDERLKNRDHKNRILFNLVALKRQITFFRYFPLDIISIPFFKVGHWCWRKWNGYL